MDRAQFTKDYNKNIAWLRRNVPPDDIYDFAEQTFMAALFFLKRLSQEKDLSQELRENAYSQKWAYNLCLILHLRSNDLDQPIDFRLDQLEDE